MTVDGYQLATDGAAALGWDGLLGFPVDQVLVVRGGEYAGIALPVAGVPGYLEELGLRIADDCEVLRQLRSVPVSHVAVVAIDGERASIYQAPRDRRLMLRPPVAAA